jgi:hypothetical protein
MSNFLPSLPEWLPFTDVCALAAQHFAPALRQVNGLTEGAVPNFGRQHAGAALRCLIQEGKIRIAIKGEGGTMQAVSAVGLEHIEWMVHGEPHGVLYRQARMPGRQLVAGPGTAHLIYVSAADMVRVAEALTPAAPQGSPALDLITASDGSELLTFETALRVIESYRDLWMYLVSVTRSPALERLHLPESAAGALAAVAITPGLSFYARDADKAWRPLYGRRAPLLITSDGWPLGYVAVSLRCDVVAEPIAVPAGAFLATLDSLRAKKAARDAADAEHEAAQQRARAEVERVTAEVKAEQAQQAEMQEALRRMAGADSARRRHAIAQAVSEKIPAPEA